MEVESPDDKLALLLAQVVVNKLCDSLAVVALKKHGRNNARQVEEKVETLNDTLANVEAKALADTHSEK